MCLTDIVKTLTKEQLKFLVQNIIDECTEKNTADVIKSASEMYNDAFTSYYNEIVARCLLHLDSVVNDEFKRKT